MSNDLSFPVPEPESTPEQEARLARIASKNDDYYTVKEFSRAAERGDIWLMNELYKSGFSGVNRHIKGGIFHWNTPIEAAAKAEKFESVQWLLAHGASPDPFCSRRSNYTDVGEHDGPLFYAIKKDHWEIAKLLLNNGANPESREYESLMRALRKGNLEIPMLMRKKMPDTLSPLLVVNMKRAAESENIDIAEIIKDRQKEILLPEPARPSPPAIAKLPEPIITPSPWKVTGKLEITKVEKKPEIGERLKDIFNFETRERITIIESLETNSRVALREHFDDIKSRIVLEKACDEFINQNGKINKNEILTKGFINRDKRPLSGGGA